MAIFRLKPADELFDFTAGQCATLGLEIDDEFIARAYSMASRPEEDRHFTSEVGRGRTTPLLEEALDDALPHGLEPEDFAARTPPESTAVYLCGNPDMIADAKNILAAKGYGEVYTEEYW